MQRITFEADCILRHLGKATAACSETVTFTGPNTATFVSTDLIYVAANGDELYARIDDGAAVLDAQGGVTRTATEIYTGSTGVLDQLRTVDRARLTKKVGRISPTILERVLGVLQEMFAA